jgi:hypothetical protein
MAAREERNQDATVYVGQLDDEVGHPATAHNTLCCHTVNARSTVMRHLNTHHNVTHSVKNLRPWPLFTLLLHRFYHNSRHNVLRMPLFPVSLRIILGNIDPVARGLDVVVRWKVLKYGTEALATPTHSPQHHHHHHRRCHLKSTVLPCLVTRGDALVHMHSVTRHMCAPT